MANRKQPVRNESINKDSRQADSAPQGPPGKLAALDSALAAHELDAQRNEILQSARQFKNNWVELAEKLHHVVRRHDYDRWGFASFDDYVRVELALKRETALKLVRSYALVQQHRPEMLQPERQHELPPVESIDYLSKRQSTSEVPAAAFESFTEQALTESWSPKMVSQKWRDLLGSEQTQEPPRDPAQRAVIRARELAERLNRSLGEIPGVAPEALESVQTILDSLAALHA